jgi:hypothetical protein
MTAASAIGLLRSRWTRALVRASNRGGRSPRGKLITRSPVIIDVVTAKPGVDLPICALSSRHRVVDESKHGTLMAHWKETSGYASVVRRRLGSCQSEPDMTRSPWIQMSA